MKNLIITLLILISTSSFIGAQDVYETSHVSVSYTKNSAYSDTISYVSTFTINEDTKMVTHYLESGDTMVFYVTSPILKTLDGKLTVYSCLDSFSGHVSVCLSQYEDTTITLDYSEETKRKLRPKFPVLRFNSIIK